MSDTWPLLGKSSCICGEGRHKDTRQCNDCVFAKGSFCMLAVRAVSRVTSSRPRRFGSSVIVEKAGQSLDVG